MLNNKIKFYFIDWNLKHGSRIYPMQTRGWKPKSKPLVQWPIGSIKFNHMIATCSGSLNSLSPQLPRYFWNMMGSSTTLHVCNIHSFMREWEVYISSADAILFISSFSSAVFVLITYTDRTSLYCLSEHLIDIEEMELVGPTPFCTLSGLWSYTFNHEQLSN